MMEYRNPAEVTAERVTASLKRGSQIRTPIPARPDRGDLSAAGPVYLRPGDEQCAGCDELIDEFGGAPYLLVLARIKRDHGETYCKDCHRSNQPLTDGGDA